MGCVVDGCSGGYYENKFHGFRFPFWKRPDLAKKWIEFAKKDDWIPTERNMICYEHFDNCFILKNKKRWSLNWDLSPIPSHNPSNSLANRPPKQEASEISRTQESENVKFEALSIRHGPNGFNFKRHNEHVIYYNLVFDEETGFPLILESIKINKDLHVQLQYKGRPAPLPSWFVTGSQGKLRRYKELHRFPAEMCAENENVSILKDFLKLINYKANGWHPYYAEMRSRT